MSISENNLAEAIESALSFYDDYELNFPLTNFIFQSPLHWNVMTIIALATFKKDYVTSFQHLCDSISSKTGSKSSIQSIVETGIQKGFIKKTPLLKDKRIKSLSLTNSSKLDYQEWLVKDAKTLKSLKSAS